MSTIFEIMKHLRDLNVLRRITWAVDGNDIVVRIPVADDEVDVIDQLEQLFGPVGS